MRSNAARLDSAEESSAACVRYRVYLTGCFHKGNRCQEDKVKLFRFNVVTTMRVHLNSLKHLKNRITRLDKSLIHDTSKVAPPVPTEKPLVLDWESSLREPVKNPVSSPVTAKLYTACVAGAKNSADRHFFAEGRTEANRPSIRRLTRRSSK
ncbi:hypothetical protein T265_02740 [Opisthorchis viverrini]|uniref:Uncharacterized protein n=1 Tax=Opisthorchis viverrini TaxID=6198 RepID=A0A074ZTX0_OPIVI|nr:hypothetical protein T265_02740 [Opisthorchis viverrini]KER30928.1 hypothetical protein T265_02740 [Opisthorchis viverrini]